MPKRALKEDVGRRQLLRRMEAEYDREYLKQKKNGELTPLQLHSHSSDDRLPKPKLENFPREIYTPSGAEDIARLPDAPVNSETRLVNEGPSTSSGSGSLSAANPQFSFRVNTEETPRINEEQDILSKRTYTTEKRISPKRTLSQGESVFLEDTPAFKKLSTKIDALLRKVDNIERILTGPVSRIKRDDDDFDLITVRTVDELHDLEDRLQDPVLKKSFVAFIASIGGRNEKEAIRNAWHMVATDDVWRHFNWEGRAHSARTVQKPGIKTSVLVKLIKKGLNEGRFPNLDRENFKEETCRFLKHAPKRAEAAKKNYVQDSESEGE